MSEDRDTERVGSIGQEAAKLIGALQEWARESGSEYAEAAASAAEAGAASLSAVTEHIATGSEDCRYCPLCQVISLVRETSPEVRAHLSAATSSLLQAAAALAADSGDPRRRSGGVEKINLTDDWDTP